MGAVFEAEHLELRRPVAVKRMLREFTDAPDMLRRFENEARAAARIGHPGIVDVLDLGTDEDGVFLVMELLDGEELEARMRREGALPIDEVVRLGRELADAVAAAHDAGIIHRDLKPANVFLCHGRAGRWRVKVLDFGIAKLLFDGSGASTRTGAVLGTPLYMAPEQLRDSKQVDVRADVYSVGAILYHALAGRPPLDAGSLPELFYKITMEQPATPSELRPDTPAWLSSLLEAALQKEPASRPQSMHAFAEALERGASRGATSVMPGPAAADTDSGRRDDSSSDAPAGPLAVEALTGNRPTHQRRGMLWLWVVVALGLAAIVVGLVRRPGTVAAASSASAQLPVATREVQSSVRVSSSPVPPPSASSLPAATAPPTPVARPRPRPKALPTPKITETPRQAPPLVPP